MMEDLEHCQTLAPVQAGAVDEVVEQEGEELGRVFLVHQPGILGDHLVVQRDPAV